MKKLIIPYLIFQTLYTIYYFLIGKADWQTGVFYPQWSLWFLFSLFSWHILLVLFKKIPAGERTAESRQYSGFLVFPAGNCFSDFQSEVLLSMDWL